MTSFRLVRLFGVDIRLHWSLPLGMLLLLWVWQPESALGFVVSLVLACALFGSVTLHELGHSLAARAFGITTRSIVLWPLGGFAILEKRPIQPWQDVIIIAAGPLANLLLAALAWALLTVWSGLPAAFSGGYNSAFGYVQLAGDALVFMNIALALFNLVPAYPLDGGQIVRRLLVAIVGETWATRVMLPWSALLVVGMLLFGLETGDPLVVVTALFIGMGALSLSTTVNKRLVEIINKRDRP